MTTKKEVHEFELPFEEGAKVKVSETYKRHWVTIARKNANGIIKGYKVITEYKSSSDRRKMGSYVDILFAIVELKSETVEIPVSYLEKYEKSKRVTLQDLSNEELVNKLGLMIADEQTRMMGTKSYDKLVDDIKKVETEILDRMK